MGLGSSTEDSPANSTFIRSLNVCPIKSFFVLFYLEPTITVRGRLYRILGVIGQGSEATVYRCEDQNAAQYAVKTFNYSRSHPSEVPQRVNNFSKEGRILQYLNRRSPHFVHLYDYEYKPAENIGYMIMELAEGSLRQQLLDSPLDDGLRRLYWRQIVTILKDLQDARVGN